MKNIENSYPAGLSGNLSQVGHHQNNGDGGLAEQTSNQISSQKQKSDKGVILKMVFSF